MKTRHKILYHDSANLSLVADQTVNLVVTSPPYPMIAMWDETFSSMDESICEALGQDDGHTAFEKMHHRLDRVWTECYRVLKPGGWACINIGDATRKISGEFQLFPNHARVVHAMNEIGFTVQPAILWRKPTNSPTKFMGSGMLPACAYITLEHEYVLIFRKGRLREFRETAAKENRHLSAYFHEERNLWFSDLWQEIPGTDQALLDPDSRSRSAAYPLEIPYRLIQMFSAYGDTILDPFLGTGTTSLAAAASGRNSVGVEIDESLAPVIEANLNTAIDVGRDRSLRRIAAHIEFLAARRAMKKQSPKHWNSHYQFPVVSSQEEHLVLFRPEQVRKASLNTFEAEHVPAEPAEESAQSTFATG